MGKRSYRVRQATEADFDALATVHEASIRTICGPFYSRELIEEWVAPIGREKYLDAVAQGATIHVAEDATGLLGFSEVHQVKGNEYNAAVFVSGGATRRGIGSALYRTAEREAVRAGAERIALNASLPAVAFYEKNGFRKLHHRFSEMPSGAKIEVVRMIRSLSGE